MPKKKNTKNAGISLEQRYTNSTAEEASKFLDDLAKIMDNEVKNLKNIKEDIKKNLAKDVGVIYDRIGVTEPEENEKRQAKGYIEINKYIIEQYRKLQTAYKKSNICKFYNEKSFFKKFKKDAKEKPECQGDTFFVQVQRNDKLKKGYYNLIDLSAQNIDTIYDGNKDWLEQLNNLDKKIKKDVMRQKGGIAEKKGEEYVPLLGLYEILIGLVKGEKDEQMNKKLETLTKAYNDAKKKKDTNKLSKEHRKAYRKRMKKMSAKEIRAEKEKKIKDTRKYKETYDKEHAEWKENVGNTELFWLQNLKEGVEIEIGDKDTNGENKYKVGVVGDIKNYLLKEDNNEKTWEKYEETNFKTTYAYQDLKKHLIAELNDILKDNKEFQLVRSTINSILTENNIYKFEKLLKFFKNHSNKLQLETGGKSIETKNINSLEDQTKKDLQELRQVTKKKHWEISDMETFAQKFACLDKIKNAIKPFEKHDGQNTFIQCTFTSNHYTPTPLLPEDSIDGKYSEKNIQMLRSGLNKAAYAIGNFAKNVKLPKQEIKIKFPMWDTGENKTFEIGKVCEIIKTMQEKYAAYMNLKKSAKELFNAITTAHKDKESFVVTEDNEGKKYNFDTEDDKTKVEKNKATEKQFEKVKEDLKAYNEIKKPNNV